MKNIMYLLFIALLFVFGCDQVSEINSPEGTVLNKHLISLPKPEGLMVEDYHTEYKYINGTNGGWFSESFSYQGGPSGTVNITSTLHFYANSFSGSQNISQTFNTATAEINFGPSMQFNVSVDYTLTITGLDLAGVDPTTLDFVYIDANGNMFAVEYESITMDLNTGMLKVNNVELDHFSRYGFVN